MRLSMPAWTGWGNRAVLAQPATGVAVPVLFAAQVARGPEAVAISFEGRSMTYREVEEAANRLARLLAGLGAGPGERVALLFSRCAEAIVAMLAVLKTGAAYLPIDPVVPDARMRFMVADAAPMAAITTAGLAERLDGCDLLVIDVDDPRIDTYPCTGLPAPDPDNIAYLIYTSGTTGTPKGVAVTHHNVTQLFDALDAGRSWRRDRCGRSVTPMRLTSRCGRSGLRCCTAGGWWWCPSGGRARQTTSTPCWLPNRSACSPRPRRRWRCSRLQGLESVALVIGAEPCPAEVVDRWAPGRVMINVYGPTETTM